MTDLFLYWHTANRSWVLRTLIDTIFCYSNKRFEVKIWIKLFTFGFTLIHILFFYMSLMSLLFFHHQTPTKTKPLTALMIKVRFSRGTCQASLHRADVVVDLKGLVVKISVLWCVEIWGHPSSQASQVLLKEMSRLKMVDKLYSLLWFAEMESGPRFLSNIFNHEVRGFSILPSCLDSLYKNGTHFVRGCFWTLIELGWTYFRTRCTQLNVAWTLRTCVKQQRQSNCWAHDMWTRNSTMIHLV